MEIKVGDKHIESKEEGSRQKFLFGKPWWGRTVLLLGLGMVFSSLGETCLILGISAIAGFSNTVAGLLVAVFLHSCWAQAVSCVGCLDSQRRFQNPRILRS